MGHFVSNRDFGVSVELLWVYESPFSILCKYRINLGPLRGHVGVTLGLLLIHEGGFCLFVVHFGRMMYKCAGMSEG